MANASQCELAVAPFFNWFSFKCSDVWSSPYYFHHLQNSSVLGKNEQFKNDVNGFFAYGAKNCVIWCQIHGNLIRYALTVKAYTSVHEKVSTISFSRSQRSPVLFIGSNQGVALLYHFDLNRLQAESCDHIFDDKIENSKNISSSDWLDDVHVFYSIDTFIVHWNTINGHIEHIKIKTQSGHFRKVDGIVISKVSPFLMAVAYSGGEIAVVKVSNEMMRDGGVQTRLFNGQHDISSLAFPYDNGPYAAGMLASITREGSLKVWELFTNNLLLDHYMDTKKSPHSKGKNFFSMSFIPPNHISGAFVYRTRNPRDARGPAEIPFKLMVSGANGGITVIEIPRTQNSGISRPKMYELEKQGKYSHSNVVFDISTVNPYIYRTKGTGREAKLEAALLLDVPLMAVTISLDRQAILWDLKNYKAKSPFQTLSHQVHDIEFNPMDPNSLAIASGDGLKIWRFSSRSDDSSNPYRIATIRKNLPSNVKFLSLSWHPDIPDVLALGTDEGGLVVINVNQAKSNLIYHHEAKFAGRNRVYSIKWGPIPENHQTNLSSKWACYLVYAGGIVKAHVPTDEKVFDFNEISDCRKAKKTDCSWKADFKYLAVGYEDGSIDILINDGILKVIIAIKGIHSDLIQCIRWHPDHRIIYHKSRLAVERREPSNCEFWIATASSDNTIHIIDLKPSLKEYEDLGQVQIVPLTKSLNILHGHKDRVISLSWCPSVDELIASCSYDQTVQVWQAELGIPLYNFRGHWSRIFTISWAPFDEDLILSGGDDSTVQIWRPSKQTTNLPPEDTNSIWNLEFLELTPDQPFPNRMKKEEESDEDFDKFLIPLLDLELEAKTYVPDIESSSSGEHANPWDPNAYTATTESGAQEESPTLTSPCQNGISNPSPSEETIEASNPVEKTEESQEKISATSRSGLQTKTSEAPKFREEPIPMFMKPQTSTKEMLQKFKSFSRATLASPSSSNIKERKKSLLPLTNVAENCSTKQQHLQDIELIMSKRGLVDKPSLINDQIEFRSLMFHGYDEISKLCYRESENHLQTNNHILSDQLKLLQGDFKSVIEEACQKNQLTDWMVGMAATVSRSFWTDTVECYAKQLEKAGEFIQSSLYFLSISRVNDAVRVLLKNGLYKEAVVVTKSRLPFNSDITVDTMAKWAKEKEMLGNLEAAAKILISIGRYQEAGELLEKRRDDEKCLSFASLLKGRDTVDSGQDSEADDDQECDQETLEQCDEQSGQ